MAIRAGRLDHVALDEVAREAGLAPASAYRYVPDIEALILLGMRRWQDEVKRRFVLFMANRDLHDETELAEAMVDFSIAQTLLPWTLPQKMVLKTLLPRYHHVNSDSVWAVAEAVLAGMPPGCPCRAIGTTRLAAALLSVANVVRGIILHDAALLRKSEARALLISLCLGALRGPDVPSTKPEFGADNRHGRRRRP